MSIIVNGNSLPNIPWEDRPSSSNPKKELMWRFSKKPDYSKGFNLAVQQHF